MRLRSRLSKMEKAPREATASERYELVLLDLVMPDAMGRAVSTASRDRPPVLSLSGQPAMRWMTAIEGLDLAAD